MSGMPRYCQTAAPAAKFLVKAYGCKGGGVELWTIHGGMHVPRLASGFAARVMAFLEAHPKP